MSVPEPRLGVRYIDAEGRLTPEGMRLLLAVVEALNALETRVEAIEPDDD